MTGQARVPRQRVGEVEPTGPSRAARVLGAVGAERGCPLAATLLAALVTLQLAAHLADGSTQPWSQVLVGGAFLVAVPLAVNLWTGRACECRTFAVLLAGCVAVGQVLAAVLGAPGGQPLGWSAVRVALVLLAAAIIVTVPVRARSLTRREGAPERGTDPYASAHVTPAAGRGGRRRDRRSAPTDVGA